MENQNNNENDKPTIQQTFNYYAPIGQQIAHVDKIVAHFRQEHGHQGGWTGHHAPAVSYRLA